VIIQYKPEDNIGNFDNKEFSIAIFICIFKSHATTFPVYISESESRLTKEGPKPINVYKQCLPRKYELFLS
jgi:hypothetical protein